ncbi:MAG: hypothetical protein AB2552_23025 [Candidatus Thiodiazotropha endolucinida]
MSILQIQGDPKTIVDTLFSVDDDGRIVFGSGATSIEATSLEILESKSVMFRDYVMEGFVKYELFFCRQNSAIQLRVKLTGTNRDQYVIPQLKWHVNQAGYEPIDIQIKPYKSFLPPLRGWDLGFASAPKLGRYKPKDELRKINLKRF